MSSTTQLPLDLSNSTASLTLSDPADEFVIAREQLINAAEAFVKEKFANHDPSHDWRHVHRVRLLALSLTNSSDVIGKVDQLVVELAALFHDLNDAKYSPTPTHTARSVLLPFFASLPQPPSLTPAQTDTIIRIVDNVSWSKDVRRRQSRARSAAVDEPLHPDDQALDGWLATCREFWCVSDADRLDAIGAIGILRCAAFSAVKMRPLYVPPANPQMDSRPPAEQGEGYNGSAVAHFHEKLVKIRGDRLYTLDAKVEAERRQQMMESFLTELDIEWMVAAQGAELSSLQ